MRKKVGWIYREPGSGMTPNRIKVKLDKNVTSTFDDNAVGAAEAAQFISVHCGDAWKLEDMAFLGCRIVVEE
jgi:hypothetical protein